MSNETPVSLSEALLAAMQATASPKPVLISVAQWERHPLFAGRKLFVKMRTVEEVEADSEWEKKVLDASADKRRRLAFGAALILCDEDGKRLLDPTDQVVLDCLAQQPWAILQKVVNAANFDENGEVQGNVQSGASS